MMNIVYAFTAYPAGVVSDRFGREGVIAIGVASLIVADIALAFAGNVTLVLVGVAFWGLHMGLTQGLFAALVADTAPEDLRGTAFGLFNFAAGLAMLAASVMAGALWDQFGPGATFIAGAGISVVSLLGFVLLSQHLRRRSPVTATPES